MLHRTLLLVAALATLSLAAAPASAELDKLTAAKVQRLEKLAEQGSFDVVVKTAREMMKDAEGEGRDVLAFHLARGLQRTHANAEAVGLLIPMVTGGGALAADAAEVLKLAGAELPDEDIDIRATVSGATVLVDGEDVGTTPASFKLKPGVYKVEVSKDGFTGAGTTLVVKPGQGSTFAADLKAKGGVLVVEADAAGLEILVDGTPRPATGVTTRLDVPAREITVALKAGGQTLKTETFDFTLGGTQTLTLRKFATLRLVNAEGATVLVDGTVTPVEKGVVRLEPGDHTVRVEKKGFQPVEASLSTLPGRDLTGTADLVAVQGPSAAAPYLWAGLGVGGALVVAAAVVGAVADLDGVANDVAVGAMGVVGVAAFSTCGFFLKRDYDAVHAPALYEDGLKISVAPTSEGAVVGLAGTF